MRLDAAGAPAVAVADAAPAVAVADAALAVVADAAPAVVADAAPAVVVTDAPTEPSAADASNVCTLGSTRCSGNSPQKCDGTRWVTGSACGNLCFEGQCVGECRAGTLQECDVVATCNPDAVRVCSASGGWGECSPAACAPLLPGWGAVAMGPSQGTCPNGFGAPRTYLTSARGGALTCACNCSGVQTCSGSVTLNDFGPTATDCLGLPTTVRKLDVSSTCGGGGGEIRLGDNYTISDVNYGLTGVCTSATTTINQPDVIVQTTTLCAALDAQKVAFSCVAHPGKAPCPDGFPMRTLMASTYSDTRGCACTCGSHLSCALAGVLLDNDPTCKADDPYVMTATSACSQAQSPGNYPLNATRALGVSTGDGTCAAIGPPTVSGGVDLDDQSTITVCCKP